MVCHVPPKRILVGVDESGHADVAVGAAAELARHFGARLDLLHAVFLPYLSGRLDAESFVAYTEDTLGGIRGQIADRIGAQVPGVDLEKQLRVIQGHPAQMLLGEAEADDVDLIVLGEHEKHGLLDFGSTARAVLAKADCPVWVQRGEVKPISRVLVPVDLSPASFETLAMARDMAAGLGAGLMVVHCFEPPALAYGSASPYPVQAPTYVVDQLRENDRTSFQEKLDSFDWKDVPHQAEFVEDSPVERILRLQEDVDLIAMGTHGRTSLGATILGSVAYKVLREARGPVLAMRQSREKWRE